MVIDRIICTAAAEVRIVYTGGSSNFLDNSISFFKSVTQPVLYNITLSLLMADIASLSLFNI